MTDDNVVEMPQREQETPAMPPAKQIADHLDHQLIQACNQARLNRQFFEDMWYQADRTIRQEGGMVVIDTMVPFAIDDLLSERHWHVSVALNSMWADDEDLVGVAEQALDFLLEVRKVNEEPETREEPQEAAEEPSEPQEDPDGE